MMPWSDHTGTPRHFHSSTTSGAACLMSARMRASVSPRQSGRLSILASISADGDGLSAGALVVMGSAAPSFALASCGGSDGRVDRRLGAQARLTAAARAWSAWATRSFAHARLSPRHWMALGLLLLSLGVGLRAVGPAAL